MQRSVSLIGCLLAAWLAPVPAAGELRRSFEDAEVVARAELMVIGALVPESVAHLPHQRRDGLRSWEYRARLRVHEVLAGADPGVEEIEVVLHYGLALVVGGYAVRDGTWRVLPGEPEPRPDQVALWAGGSVVEMAPFVPDADRDWIWMLRRGLRSPDVASPSDDRWGIRDPEDVQPLGLRDYLLAYLAADPEAALEPWRDDPRVAERVAVFFDRRAVEHSAAIADPATRAAVLLEIYLRQRAAPGREARSALVDLGPAAGPLLLQAFRAENPRGRSDLIALLGEVGYGAAVEPLIHLLDKSDAFWRQQQLEREWWNDLDHPATGRRRAVYGEELAAIRALGLLGDLRGAPTVSRALARWRDAPAEGFQIVETCERALDGLAAR